MFLQTLPPTVRIAVLAIAGAVIGALINFLVYRLCYFSQRSISPWMPQDEKGSARKALDFIPILGWFSIRRDHEVHGKGFWIRPLMIELTWMVGLPLFYAWQMNSGITGGPKTATGAVNLAIAPDWMCMTWFYAHTALIALMFVATFIDYDEMMIPDAITVPGTLLGLLLAAFAPWFHLPDLLSRAQLKRLIAEGSETTVNAMHLNSPGDLPAEQLGWIGLAVGMLVLTIWIIAILPMHWIWRPKLGNSLKIMVGSLLRPKRKTKCDIRIEPRKRMPETIIYGLLWIGCMVALPLAWKTLPPASLTSLSHALLGMAFAGGLTWMVRIIGGYAMGREAMGFGDVTLMAMIGTFVGWQPSLIIFGLSSLLGLVFMSLHKAVYKDREFPYGPALCAGTLLLLLFWAPIWGYSRFHLFFMGPYLLLVLLGGLVLMGLMLAGIAWMKGPYIEEDDE